MWDGLGGRGFVVGWVTWAGRVELEGWFGLVWYIPNDNVMRCDFLPRVAQERILRFAEELVEGNGNRSCCK